MTTHAAMAAPLRTSKRGKTNPISAGLPDPRPLTDYSAAYEELDGHSRVTVTLGQPCVIRNPRWTFIDCSTGESIPPALVKPIGNDTIQFDFAGIIADTIAFVDVPYQDMQVQNFQGGFVRPGAKWFRAPK